MLIQKISSGNNDLAETTNHIYILILSGISSIFSLVIYARQQETIEIKLSKDNEKLETNQDIEKSISFLTKSANEFCSKNDVNESIEKRFNRLCNTLEAGQGLYYQSVLKNEIEYLELKYTFAYLPPPGKDTDIEFGTGFTGLAAKEKQILIINSIPEDYFEVISGLGKSKPSNLIVIPIINENKVLGVIELATLYKATKDDLGALEQISKYFNELLLEEKIDTSSIAQTHA